MLLEPFQEVVKGQIVNVANAAAIVGGGAVTLMYNCLGTRNKAPIKLSVEEQIEKLYGEIQTLKKAKFDGIEIRNQSYRLPGQVFREKEIPKEIPENIPKEAIPGKEIGKEKEKDKVDKFREVLKDPYTNILETWYAPPANRFWCTTGKT
ncbi:hypothetical protein L208DRAFT_1379573 [Tricholoma matsutake]|nr:hypothetical protein L208DRAFT_1379573 [Tricholoma matsutake 945]